MSARKAPDCRRIGALLEDTFPGCPPIDTGAATTSTPGGTSSGVVPGVISVRRSAGAMRHSAATSWRTYWPLPVNGVSQNQPLRAMCMECLNFSEVDGGRAASVLVRAV